MCPLIAAPNRGYADYQRIGNFDSGVLWSVTSALSNAEVTSPIIDVSRYAYLVGVLGPGFGVMNINMVWFADPVGVTLVGEREFHATDQIIHQPQIHFPNLGPFVQIYVTALALANFRVNGDLIGTNRVHQLDFIPYFPLLINNQVFAVAVGDNPYYPTDYYAGPVLVSLINAGAGQTLYHQVLNSAGVWDYTEAHAVTGGSFSYESIMPPGAWRIVINSTGAVGGLRFAVTPSTTGAS